MDKKGLAAGVELAAVGIIILVSAQFIGRELTALAIPPPAADIAVLGPRAPLDENAFYIEPPGDKPVFLSGKELGKKREALVWEKRDFLFIDLDRGMISLYEKGALRADLPVVASAGEGSFFDPPQGFYSVQGKAENHFSQIERRLFPWTIYLFGNYLIHAFVPAAGRAAVASSGERGGIQLALQDAKNIFAKVNEGTPILVSRTDSPAAPSFAYFRKTNLPHRVPEVTAASALAADLETGEILFEKNKNDAYPTASLTKLMTAAVASEEIEPEKLLTVTDEALATYGDSAGLIKGEAFRSADLLHALILASSNDAAAVYQQAVPEFLTKLNGKAQSIGLYRTFFADPSGLSRDNVTSAGDLFTLLKYIEARHPEILVMSREKISAKTSENKKKRHLWTNINWPRDDKRYLGGKAGFTDDSLQTMAGIWSARVTEYGGRRVAIAVLGSRNRIRDVRAIINYLERDFVYGFANFDNKKYTHSGFSGAAIYKALLDP